MEGHTAARAFPEGPCLADPRMAAPAGPCRRGCAGTVAQPARLLAHAPQSLAEHAGGPARHGRFFARGVRGHGRLPVVQVVCGAVSHQGERAGLPVALSAALSPALPAAAARLSDRLAGIFHAVAGACALAVQRHHGQPDGAAPAGNPHRHGGQPAAVAPAPAAIAEAMAGTDGLPRHTGRPGRRRPCPQRDSGAGQLHPLLRNRTAGRLHRTGGPAGPACMAGAPARQRQTAAGAGLSAGLCPHRPPAHPQAARTGGLRHSAGGSGPGHDTGVPAGVHQGRGDWRGAEGTAAAGMAAGGAGC